MSFALEENEPFPAAIKRLAVEQIDLALHHLSSPSEDLDISIHATRQSLKRVRALLVLVRSELGDEVFEREWTCYAEAGRLLAKGRDASVAVETFDALAGRFPSELTPNASDSIRRFLADRRDAQLKIMVEGEGALKNASEILVCAHERVPFWPAGRAGFRAVRKGLRRSYRAGRDGLETVVHHPTPAGFHEWRKPVKLLWHQLQVLTPIWPVILDAHAEELRALSDRLNENHDLDTLRRTVPWSGGEIKPRDRRALSSLVDRRCRQLESEGLRLGGRLYSEGPRRFTARLEGYWQAWRRGVVTVRPSPADESIKLRQRALPANHVAL
jgi:hypothetical protein